MKVKASIIILTKNAEAVLEGVLRSVFNSNLEEKFEVIVIDSNSTDMTKEIAAKYPVRFYGIPAKEFSHGGTRNMGAKLAQGEFVVFLTQDAMPCNTHWLASLLACFEAQDIAAVYGRQIPRLTSPIEEFYLRFLYPEHRIWKKGVSQKDCLLKDIFFSNVNSAIRKSVWEKYRFNEALIMSEDQEWSKRVLGDGYAILYEPAASVIHSHNYGPLQLFSRNFDSGMSLKGIVHCKFVKALRYELRYVFEAIMYLQKKKSYLWLLFFPVYEVSKLAGFTLGFYHRYIPYLFRKRLSQHTHYWK